MPAHPDAIDLAVAIARAADDIKASDLALYDVADVLALVDAFVLASTATDRQLKAVVDNVEEVMRRDHDQRPLRREGTAESGWVLLDYGDVVAHVFQREQREFYDLDRLFSDVPTHDPLTGTRTGDGSLAGGPSGSAGRSGAEPSGAEPSGDDERDHRDDHRDERDDGRATGEEGSAAGTEAVEKAGGAVGEQAR